MREGCAFIVSPCHLAAQRDRVPRPRNAKQRLLGPRYGRDVGAIDLLGVVLTPHSMLCRRPAPPAVGIFPVATTPVPPLSAVPRGDTASAVAEPPAGAAAPPDITGLSPNNGPEVRVPISSTRARVHVPDRRGVVCAGRAHQKVGRDGGDHPRGQPGQVAGRCGAGAHRRGGLHANADLDVVAQADGHNPSRRR